MNRLLRALHLHLMNVASQGRQQRAFTYFLVGRLYCGRRQTIHLHNISASPSSFSISFGHARAALASPTDGGRTPYQSVSRKRGTICFRARLKLGKRVASRLRAEALYVQQIALLQPLSQSNRRRQDFWETGTCRQSIEMRKR